LTIHQRALNRVIPRADAQITVWRRALYKYIPPVRWRYRANMMDVRESLYYALIDKTTPFVDLLVNMSKDMVKA
jgi:hypothetical protein